MAIYALPAILFAYVFYNMKQSFSIGSMLKPILGDWIGEKAKAVIDGLCLFCLCMGLSSSLGSGVLLIVQGASPCYRRGNLSKCCKLEHLWTDYHCVLYPFCQQRTEKRYKDTVHGQFLVLSRIGNLCTGSRAYSLHTEFVHGKLWRVSDRLF